MTGARVVEVSLSEDRAGVSNRAVKVGVEPSHSTMELGAVVRCLREEKSGERTNALHPRSRAAREARSQEGRVIR